MINSESELKALIAEGESETLEFKPKFDIEATKSLGAMANARGGYVLVGVLDDGTVKGTSVGKETLKTWGNDVSNASEPTLIPEISLIETGEKKVVVLFVKEFPIKPLAIKGRCYRRVGPSNRQMTPAEITELHMHSMGTTWDTVVSPGKALNDIDLERVKQYRDLAIKVGRRHFEGDEDPSTLLEKLDLVKDGALTWASIIAFGKKPPMQAKVKCGKIRGTSTIVDDFVVDAPLLEQVKEVMNYMRRVFQLGYEFTGQPRHTEVWEYPMEAVKEAVTNAICHRDYTSSAEIQIKIFDDELVIWNPGPLPIGMTIEKLMDPKHNSVPRNRLLAMLFYDIELIERYGSGIKRILDNCKLLNFPEPEFNEYQNGFQVIFHKDIYNEEYLKGMGLNERQIKAILFVRDNGKITNREYQELNNISRQTATRELSNLVDRKLLIRHGKTGRDSHYTLSEENST